MVVLKDTKEPLYMLITASVRKRHTEVLARHLGGHGSWIKCVSKSEKPSIGQRKPGRLTTGIRTSNLPETTKL